jgi:hypothetical protein
MTKSISMSFTKKGKLTSWKVSKDLFSKARQSRKK